MDLIGTESLIDRADYLKTMKLMLVGTETDGKKK